MSGGALGKKRKASLPKLKKGGENDVTTTPPPTTKQATAGMAEFITSSVRKRANGALAISFIPVLELLTHFPEVDGLGQFFLPNGVAF